MKSARVVWPLALLVLFLGTFRRTLPDASAAQAGDVDPTDVAVLTDLGDVYLKDGRVDLAEQAHTAARWRSTRAMATCTFGSANCCSSAGSRRRVGRNGTGAALASGEHARVETSRNALRRRPARSTTNDRIPYRRLAVSRRRCGRRARRACGLFRRRRRVLLPVACSPFAYAQFIKPNVVPALTDSHDLAVGHLCVVVLLTTLTLMPQLRGGPGHWLALAYVVPGARSRRCQLRDSRCAPSATAASGYCDRVAGAGGAGLGRSDRSPREAGARRSTRAAPSPARGLHWRGDRRLGGVCARRPGSSGQPAGDCARQERARGCPVVVLVVDLYGFTALFLALATLIAIARVSSTPAR